LDNCSEINGNTINSKITYAEVFSASRFGLNKPLSGIKIITVKTIDNIIEKTMNMIIPKRLK
jgi:hypothetical protein